MTPARHARPTSAPPTATLSIPRSLTRQLERAAANRRSVEAGLSEKENARQLKAERARELYMKVQTDRRLHGARASASVAACKDDKRERSQLEKVMLQEAIHHTSMAQQEQIEAKVTLAKLQTAGRVAQARAALLEKKRAERLAVALDQKAALDEKARRLEERQQEHAVQYARKFEEVALSAAEGVSEEHMRYLVRSRMPTTSQHLLGSSVASTPLTNASRVIPTRAHDIALMAASARSAAHIAATLRPDLRAGYVHSASAPRL